jgi:hypothetical protein
VSVVLVDVDRPLVEERLVPTVEPFANRLLLALDLDLGISLHYFECEAFQDDEITPPPRNYLSLPPARALLGTMTQDRTSDAFFRVSHERR